MPGGVESDEHETAAGLAFGSAVALLVPRGKCGYLAI